MKKILLIILLFSLGAFAQETIIAAKTDSLQLQSDVFLGKDVLGAIYFIKDNALIKTSKQKDWQYKNPALGKIAKVDLQNSLKLLLFYESFNTIVLLDNQLNEIQKINLSEIDPPVVASASGLAFGNRLWIYNTLTQKVGLYDYLKKEYREISTPFRGNVKYYTSDFNYLDWIDEHSDWYRCDIYGKVTALGKVPEHEQLRFISDHGLLYKKDNRLYYFTFVGNKSTLIDVDKKTYDSFLYKDKILSIFTKHGITNYKITLP